MRLTKNLKRVIVGQFKTGDSIEYLASIYGVSAARVENVVRERLLALDETIGAETRPAETAGSETVNSILSEEG